MNGIKIVTHHFANSVYRAEVAHMEETLNVSK